MLSHFVKFSLNNLNLQTYYYSGSNNDIFSLIKFLDKYVPQSVKDQFDWFWNLISILLHNKVVRSFFYYLVNHFDNNYWQKNTLLFMSSGVSWSRKQRKEISCLKTGKILSEVKISWDETNVTKMSKFSFVEALIL